MKYLVDVTFKVDAHSAEDAWKGVYRALAEIGGASMGSIEVEQVEEPAPADHTTLEVGI